MSKAKPVAKTPKKKLQKTKDPYREQLKSVLSETEGIEAEAGNRYEDDLMRTRLAEAESVLVKAAAAKEPPLTGFAEGKQTEEAFDASEERSRLILDSSPDPIVIYDGSGNVVDVNPAFTETFGWQKEELLGKRIDFVPEESREETRGFIERILRDEKVKAAETKRFTKNGRVLDIQLSASLIKDRSGQSVGNIVILRDITYKKRAEEMLRQNQRAAEEANARLANAFESLDVGIVMYTPDERLAACNARYKELYSRSAHLMVPGTPYEAILRESYRQGNYAHTGLTEDEWVNSRLTLHRAAGAQGPYEQQVDQRWIRVSDSRASDGSIVSVRMDITANKRAEAQIHLQSAALETAANSIVITDTRGTINWVNQAFTKNTGYAFNEAVGQNPRILKSGRHDEAFYKNLWETVLAGNVWQGEIINRYKDGQLHYEEQSITPVRDERGTITNFVIIKQDITERKTAEEELRAREERYEAVTQTANYAIVTANAQGTIIDWNHGAEQIFQYQASDVLEQPLTILMPERYRSQHKAGIHRVNSGGEHHVIGKTVELHGKRKDGSEFPLELSISTWETQNGRFYTAIISDITERKQTEARLRLQSTVLETAANSVVITDVKGTIVWVNPALTRNTGYTFEEVVGQNPRIFKSGQHDDAFYKNIWGTVLAGAVWQGEIINRYKDGQLHYEEQTITPVRDERGTITNFVVIKQEITERKQAEEALRAREERYEAVTQTANYAIVTANAQGAIIDWNHGAEKIFQYQANEVSGQLLTILMPERYHSQHQEGIRRVNSGGEHHVLGKTVELHGTRKDGSEFPLELSLSTWETQDGRFFTAIISDITERKRIQEAEREQRALAEALRNSAAAMNSTLNFSEVLDRILDNIEQVVAHETANVMLIDAQGEARVVGIRGYAKHGVDENELLARRWHVDSITNWRMLRETRQPLVVPDTQADPNWRTFPGTEWIRSYLGAPIIIRDAVAGFIHLDSATPGFFTPSHIERLRSFADQAAIAIENTQLYDQSQQEIEQRKTAEAAMVKRAAELQAVAEISTATSIAPNVQQTLQSVVDLTKERFDLYHAHIYLLDVLGENLVLSAGAGEVGKQMAARGHSIPFNRPHSLVARAARTHQGVISNDVTQEPDFLPNPLLPHTRSELATPIIVGDAVLGIFDVQSEVTNRFTDEDIAIQTTLAQQLGAALQNARSLERAETLVAELNDVTRGLVREGWADYKTGELGQESFVYDLAQVSRSSDVTAIPETDHFVTPLAVRGEVIGELAVVEPQEIVEARQIAEAIAQRLSAHIENLRLSEQTQVALAETNKRAVELEAVAEVTTATSTILERDRLLASAVHLTQDRFELYHCHVFLFDYVTNNLGIVACGWRGEEPQDSAHGRRLIHITQEQSLVARAARDREAVLVNDVTLDPAWLPNDVLPETKAELAVPMVVGETLVGVFDAQSEVIGRFSDDDVRTFSTLANAVAVAVQNATLYAEQIAAVARLKELDQLKSSFLANMSHELRTPLNSIIGFTEVLLEGIDGELTESMDNDLKVIHKNGQHLLNLINDVLDMAKIEAGRMTLTIEEFNLQEVIEEVAEITRPLANAKSLELRLAIDQDEDLTLEADRIRLRQVMINVVNNSIKFTESGYVAIGAYREEGVIKVIVKDSGIGIPSDQLDTIFQEFTQVDTSTTRKAGGTGLGLPISRHLVELHGGHLWAESSGVAGEGSMFYIELPMIAKRATE